MLKEIYRVRVSHKAISVVKFLNAIIILIQCTSKNMLYSKHTYTLLYNGQ